MQALWKELHKHSELLELCQESKIRYKLPQDCYRKTSKDPCHWGESGQCKRGSFPCSHVFRFLVAEGAKKWALKHGFKPVDESELVTPHSKLIWQNHTQRLKDFYQFIQEKEKDKERNKRHLEVSDDLVGQTEICKRMKVQICHLLFIITSG